MIEFIGRNDFQVKIRGFRIELGDIETGMRQHPQLREVVVSVYEPILGDKRLVAYLVPEKDSMPSASELRDFLKNTMPDYMVPSVFIFLEALPLTPNGKLDRKALPEPDQYRNDLTTEFIAPRSLLEKKLGEIWAEVLRHDRIGIHDNFFELGGHSLLATQVIVRIGEQLSVGLSLSSLFELPTIAELAKLIEKTEASESTHLKSIIRRPRQGINVVKL
jgi:acyl carrier protein